MTEQRINIPQGQDNLQFDANALEPGYLRPSPVQALYYKQVKFYGLCAIDDDDIDEFNEYVSTAKNERIPLALTLTKITSAIKNEMYVIIYYYYFFFLEKKDFNKFQNTDTIHTGTYYMTT